MFIGHYGVSFAAKRGAPSIPLWVTFIAVQFLDVLWSLLVLLGVEKVRIVPGITATNPLDLYYMPYTHSLIAAVLWSVVLGTVYFWTHRAKRAALVVGAAVLSHWVLDFIVHRPDLPLYDNSTKVGLGLWNLPTIAFTLETVLLFGGMTLYLRTTNTRRAPMVVFGVIMVVVQAVIFFGARPKTDTAAALSALLAYALYALAAAWLEKLHRPTQEA